MHRCLWPTICLTVSGLIASAAPLASRPSPPDQAAAARWIRQLDDPRFQKRQEAAQALIRLGPVILPQLEKAGPAASFEVRASLQQIISTLHDLLRGVIVCKVAPNAPARQIGIQVGDVIVRMAGEPIANRDAYSQLVSENPREAVQLTVRSDGDVHEVSTVPGRLGIQFADYEERYGPPLIEALRAFDRQQMPEARADFLEARQAGLKFTERDPLLPMFALATYYAGDPSTACKLLDEWAGLSPGGSRWSRLQHDLPALQGNCTHLSLYVARQRRRIQPDSIGLSIDYAQRLCALNQQPEAIVALFAGFERGPKPLDDFDEAVAWSTLLTASESLDLAPEAANAISRLKRTQARANLWNRAASVAERCRRIDLAMSILHDMAEGWRQAGRFEPDAWSETVRLGLLAGKETEVLAAIRALQPGECSRILARMYPGSFHWAKARAVMVELARRSMRSAEAGDLAAAKAFEALSGQKDLDPVELQALFDRRANSKEQAGEPTARPLARRENLIFMAMARGDFAEAQRLLERASKDEPPVQDSLAEAVCFLSARSPSLVGDLAVWRRTCQAWPLPEGGWLLLTRDDRLGVAAPDARTVREIPLPAGQWVTAPEQPAAFLSPGRNRLLTTSGDALYLLKPDRTGWELIARMPPGYSRDLRELGPVLDELVPAFRVPSGKPARIAWPPALGAREGQVFSIMLADGTWLAWDKADGKLRRPREAAVGALRVPLDIYEVLPVSDGLERAYLFTTQGLLDWRPRTGKVSRVPLPGVAEPMPVTSSSEGIPPGKGTIRVALFPRDGGTTFLVDTATGQARREGCINDSCPITYWEQKPVPAKRERVERALREAGLSTP